MRVETKQDMCPEANILAAWIDGELSTTEAAAVAAHVNDCADCVTGVAALKSAGDRVRSAPLPQPTAGSHSRWAAGLRLARDRQVRRLAGWMTAAASVVLAITLPMATNQSADARPTSLTDWEAAAVGTSSDDVATPQAQARLIAVDLALPMNSSGTATNAGQK